MTDDGELFTGTEDATAPPTNSEAADPNDAVPLSGSDSVAIREWLADLTYREVHAFTVGFAPPFLALVVAAVGHSKIAATFWGLAALVHAVAYGTKKLGGTLNRTLRYIVPEPHYAAGGSVLGVLVGAPVMGLVSLAATPWGGFVILTALVGLFCWFTLGGVRRVSDRFGWWP